MLSGRQPHFTKPSDLVRGEGAKNWTVGAFDDLSMEMPAPHKPKRRPEAQRIPHERRDQGHGDPESGGGFLAFFTHPGIVSLGRPGREWRNIERHRAATARYSHFHASAVNWRHVRHRSHHSRSSPLLDPAAA